jgi:hypothetical protein
MEPARAIGKLGFKRWYERQLIEGHAWLITCVLCGLAIAASLEEMSFRESAFKAVLILGFVFAAALLCWYALQRYRVIMDEAERMGELSICGSCRAYAAFKVIGEYPKMNVRCKKCSHEWTIS